MKSWKCSADIYDSDLIKEITKPCYLRDGLMSAREGILFRLFSYCTNGGIFNNARDFSKFSKQSLPQCQIVWDVCIALNVLRRDNAGYSTIEWMKEQGYLNKGKTTPDLTQETILEKTTDNTSDNQNSLPAQTSVKIDASPQIETETTIEQPAARPEPVVMDSVQTDKANQLQKHEEIKLVDFCKKEIKECVRPNVYLTRTEINELKKQFTDEQIAKMVDHLSEYKYQNNRRYSSDFQAIQRWVIRWLNESKNSVRTQLSASNNIIADNEFPDWLKG